MRTTRWLWLFGAAVTFGTGAPSELGTPSQSGSAAPQAGQTRTVCGAVAAIRTSRTGDVLDVDGPDPHQPLRVFLPVRDGFDAAVAARVTGLRICVLGRIEQDTAGLLIKLKDLTTLRAAVLEIARPNGFPSEGGVDLTEGRTAPDVVKPKIVQQPEPHYNSMAMRARVQGDVRMEGVVGPDGAIGSLRITRSLDALYGLDDEAMQTARRWKFEPARRNGQPIAVMVTLVLTFRLH